MSDPFERAAASPPPTLGEGCLRRFDPERMDETLGTEFADAAALWAARVAAAEQDGDHRSADEVTAASLG